MRNFSKIVACLSLVIGSAASAQPGSAIVTGYELYSEQVSYADLDLSSAADVASLQRRIRNAARNVCGPSNGVRPLREREAVLSCNRNAVSDVQDDVRLAIAGQGDRRFAARTIGVRAER